MLRSSRILVLIATLVVPAALAAQDAPAYRPVTQERLLEPEPENWLMYRRTYDGWGYSPLEQIDTSNVASLAPLWTFSTSANEGHQSPPIVNDGIMFITTPGSRIIALDARTGNSLWRYVRDLPEDLQQMHPTNRGVALWQDKVYVATVDAFVVALEATTGEVVWEKAVEDYSVGYYMTMAPLAINGKIMVGVSGGEWGIRGFVTALDAESGDEVWKTYTIPGPGERGHKSWPGETWRTGGAPVWVTGTYDPKLNLTYWGTGNGGPWMGDARPGDNLYATSVIALDADSGKLRGHHQYHWNGSWDWDEVDPPMLLDVKRGGRTRKALVHPGRNGYLWILERKKKSIGFIDATAYVYQNAFASIDAKTGRPSYDPEHTPGTGKSALTCPGVAGGKNWPPAAYNPKTGLLYIPANENTCSTLEGEEVEYRPGRVFTGCCPRLPSGSGGRSSLREGWDHIGELQAWDLNAGKKVWTTEFELQLWGPVLTTGGGLVFMGGTGDRYFRAFDATTGDILWRQRTNSGITGVPSSYEIDGTQYVAVQSGWGVDAQRGMRGIDRFLGTKTYIPFGGVLWVFALPEAD